MNCKQGDLAVVVHSAAGHEGKIVRCVKFAGDKLYRRLDGTIASWPSWHVEPPLCGFDGDIRSGCTADWKLRPIRDNDGEDETLTWAGKPEAVPA